MKAAAKVGNSRVVADSVDGIIEAVEKRRRAGKIADSDCAECRATLYEDGIP